MHAFRHADIRCAHAQAACKQHKWVLCLDDDVLLHPSSLADLVAAVEADPEAFMATGEASTQCL